MDFPYNATTITEPMVAAFLQKPPAEARLLVERVSDPDAALLYNKTVLVHAYGSSDSNALPSPSLAAKLQWWSLDLPFAASRLRQVALAHLTLRHFVAFSENVLDEEPLYAPLYDWLRRQDLSHDCVETWFRHHRSRKTSLAEAAVGRTAAGTAVGADPIALLNRALKLAEQDARVRVTSSVSQARQDLARSAYLQSMKRRPWEAEVKGWDDVSEATAHFRPLPFAELETAGLEFRDAADRLRRRLGIEVVLDKPVNVVELVDAHIEMGAAFTLGRTVFVRPDHRPYKHEFVHIAQRFDPGPFHKLYTQRLGFDPIPVHDAMARLRSPAVDNPDASLFEASVAYVYDGFLPFYVAERGGLRTTYMDTRDQGRRPPPSFAVPFLDHPAMPLDHPHEMLAYHISV